MEGESQTGENALIGNSILNQHGSHPLGRRHARYLRDWQLWRRTPDGWRFFRGIHYAAKGDPPR